MPGNIRGRYRNASDPETESIRAELDELRRDVHHLVRALNEQAARPNPAPAPSKGLSDDVLVQLLLAERSRADQASERLLEAQDPVRQINGMLALAEMMPQPNDGDGEDSMLKNALMALGSVIVDKMDTESEATGDQSAHYPDETYAQEQHPEPSEPLFVAVDTEPGPQPPAPGSMEMG